jgi:uncharacterized membrane protein
MEQQFNEKFNRAGFAFALLPVLIVLSYVSCSCNAVKTALNIEKHSKDSSVVVDTASSHVHKADSYNLALKENDNLKVDIKTPTSLDRNQSFTIKYNGKELTVPAGTEISLEKSSAKEQTQQRANNYDSGANKGHTDTHLKDTVKIRDKDKESVRTASVIFISCFIFLLIMYIVFHYIKKPAELLNDEKKFFDEVKKEV